GIEVGGGCIAFMGNSGAGKSTLVAALAQRGYVVLSDDVSYVRANSRGRPDVWPSPSRLRLWDSAMQALGYDRATSEREFRGFDKYLVPVASPWRVVESRPLLGAYQLDATSPGSQVVVERLTGTTAVEALLENTYRLYLAELMALKPVAFATCAQ